MDGRLSVVHDMARPSTDVMVVVFEEWNWGTWVTMRRTAGEWIAITVEADGEGNE